MTSSERETAARAALVIPGVPRDDDGPVFREPWEAQAFAMVLLLHERGLFTWTEWARALAAEIAHAEASQAGGVGDGGVGEDYYRHWLAALEHVIAEKDVASAATQDRYRAAWSRAAERTPHGSPIELAQGDFRA